MQTIKKNEKTKLFSIGIPTYEAGESLVAVIKSISAQSCYKQISKILIAVDGQKISPKILNKITEKKVKIVYFKNRQGQSARINDIFSLSNTEKLVLTNDDVVLGRTSLECINNKYEDADLIGGNVISLKDSSILERSLNLGQKIRASIASSWNSGNNYLNCNGRLIVLSKKLYKKISIPEKIWNNDAYIYLKSQELKLKFKFAKELTAYYKSPATIREHMSQSSKFQKSTEDLQRYFKKDIAGYYKIPATAIFKSLVINLLKRPQLTAVYLLVFVLTRLKNQFTNADFWFQSFWETDLSTKNLTNI